MNAQRMSVPSHFLQIQDLWADYGGHWGATRMPKHYAVTADLLRSVPGVVRGRTSWYHRQSRKGGLFLRQRFAIFGEIVYRASCWAPLSKRDGPTPQHAFRCETEF